MGVYFLGRSIVQPSIIRRRVEQGLSVGVLPAELRSRVWIGAVVIGIVLLTLTTQTRADESPTETVAVIVNRHGPLTAATEADIRAIYLGERQFMGGAVIVPLHLPDGPAKTAFLTTVVKLSPKAYKLFWLQRVFQGVAILPNTVAEPSVMVATVAAQHNTVGYVPLRYANGNSQVTVLFVTHVQ